MRGRRFVAGGCVGLLLVAVMLAERQSLQHAAAPDAAAALVAVDAGHAGATAPGAPPRLPDATQVVAKDASLRA